MLHTILLVLFWWVVVVVVGLALWAAAAYIVPALQVWPWGRRPRWHRHQWRITRVTTALFDPAKGLLYYCTVDGCGKVHAK